MQFFKLSFLFSLIGSIHFSIALFCSSIFVIAVATLIELPQETQNGLFFILMVGFFLNLLFSLIRRFPFRLSHVSFVLAHCGLMIVLGSALVNGYFGWEGAWVVTKSGGQDEVVIGGDRTSQLLHPFKCAAEKAGYCHDDILSLWFKEWKNRGQSVFDKDQLLPLQVERVIEYLDWAALPVSFQIGAARLSCFLERLGGGQVNLGLAREIFKGPQFPVKASPSTQPQEFLSLGVNWSLAEKAHLYSCCLFVEGVGRAFISLHLKRIPYIGLLLGVDEVGQFCSLALTRQGGIEYVQIALNRPFDTREGYRFTLQEIAPSGDQVQLFVSWRPLSNGWLWVGTVLTAVGVIILCFQKVRYGV